MYKVTSESQCGRCEMPDECCRTKNIPFEAVFKNLASGKLFAFVHDLAECSGMTEVEKEDK